MMQVLFIFWPIASFGVHRDRRVSLNNGHLTLYFKA